MTKCTQPSFEFPRCRRRRVTADFSGGDITSNGGVLLLREADRRLGLIKAIAGALSDPRRQASCRHDTESLLRQRVFGLALGYEDLNDHDVLRADAGLQTALGRDQALASASTLCRWENRADRSVAWLIHQYLIDQFIASYARPPKELVLDFDATDDPVHGGQEKRFFHGYYDHYCFLPLYVFCGRRLLVSYLRPSKIDGGKHAWAILALLVKRLRQAWPGVKLILRGDSGFCRWRMLRWCEDHGVGYIVGLAKNACLLRAVKEPMAAAAQTYAATEAPVRLFRHFHYAADTWDRTRRVIAKIEHLPKGANPRFIVTNLAGDPQTLYEQLYCARGDMENRIKEQQLDLFADRTSCHYWWPNQLRLLLSSLAYVLLDAIRRLALHGTRLARAYVGTLRLTLLKIGAVVLRNTRRVRLLMSSTCPHQHLFFLAAARLAPG